MDSPRIIIASRVSSDEQATHGTSMESQLEAGREYVKRIGGTVVGTCVEPGVSGALYESREELQRNLRRLEADEADAIVWYDVTRMSRDIEYITAITKRIARAGKSVFFCTEEYQDTADGFISKGIKGVLSHGERLKIRERTTRGSRNRAKAGIQPKRTFPAYGYHIVTKIDIMHGRYPIEMEGKYVVIEQEAEVVRKMFKWYNEGLSLHKIAERLTLEGIPTKRGGLEWQITTVHRIITQEIYKGIAHYGRFKKLLDETRIQRGLNKYYERPAPAEDVVTIPAPRLISDELWDAVQDRLKENPRTKSGRPDRRYMLSGLLRCPQCGCGMNSRANPSRQMRRRRDAGEDVTFPTFYMCIKAYQSPIMERRCSNTPYPIRETEAKVLRLVANALQKPEIIEASLLKQQAKASGKISVAELTRLQKQIRDLRAREESLVEAQIRGISSGVETTVYERKLVETAQQRGTLEARLREIESIAATEARTTAAAQTQAQAIAAMAGDVSAALLAPREIVADVEKYEILQRLIKAITPSGGTFHIEWRPAIMG